MFTSDNNPFDPSKMAEMMKSADFSKMFDFTQFKGMDQSALFDAQKKNMDALVAAQQAAPAPEADAAEAATDADVAPSAEVPAEAAPAAEPAAAEGEATPAEPVEETTPDA